ncbi:MAG: hypothetical protein ACRELY_13990 [Polyangiaceae bacterium]
MDLDDYLTLFDDRETIRYAYLRLPRLKEALENEKVIHAVMGELGIDRKPAVLRSMSRKEKLTAIEHHVRAQQTDPHSEWFDHSLPNIIAACVFASSRLTDGFVDKLFSYAKRESDLFGPVSQHCEKNGYDVHAEIDLSRKKADIVLLKTGMWGGLLTSDESVAIELKNDPKQAEHALDQMTTYRDYVHQVYLACTPFMAAEMLSQHAKRPHVRRWDFDLLHRRLNELGLGLLLVEGNDVYEVIEPDTTTPDPEKVKELKSAIEGADQAKGRRRR